MKSTYRKSQDTQVFKIIRQYSVQTWPEIRFKKKRVINLNTNFGPGPYHYFAYQFETDWQIIPQVKLSRGKVTRISLAQMNAEVKFNSQKTQVKFNSHI